MSKENLVPVQIRLPPDTRRALAMMAAESGKRQSQVVREMIDAARKKSK